MKKRIDKKLNPSKETLRNLSGRDMRGVAGGITAVCSNTCEPTLASDCHCFTDDCSQGGSGCPLTYGGQHTC